MALEIGILFFRLYEKYTKCKLSLLAKEATYSIE